MTGGRVRTTRWLTNSAPIVVALSFIGALVSIVARWPHQFGGHGNRNHMLSDFISSGTALAPPFAFLVVFGVASLVVRRRDIWGTVACVVILALSVLMVVGSMGEALAGSTPDVPRAVQWFSGIWGTTAGVTLAALSFGSLRERRQSKIEDTA